MDERPSIRRHITRRHIDKKLLFRLKIFLAISFIMLLAIIYDIFQNIISLPLAITGIVIGVVLGLLVGRIFNVLWHEGKQQVISELDMIGVAILTLYLVFSLLRNWLLAQWISGSVLTAFTFALLAGLMFGRFMSMGFRIRSILRTRGLFRLDK